MAANPGAKFIESYNKCATWPSNLLNRCETTAIADRHRERLQTSDELFSGDILIPCFDIDPQIPTALATLESEEDLEKYFTNGKSGALRQDTACRVICLNARTSRAPLNITLNALCRILSFYQVMADIGEFLVVFGLQDSGRGIKFSAFRSQTQLSAATANLLRCDEIDRRGQRYQICYNLKAAAYSTHGRYWSIRQTVLHHQFDVIDGKSLWLTIQGNRDMETLLKEVLARKESSICGSVQQRFKATLEVQRECCRSLFSQWQAYIEYLEAQLDRMDTALFDLKTPPNVEHDEILNELHNNLIFLESKSVQARMALESNIDMLGSLEQFYKDFCNLEVEPVVTTKTNPYPFHDKSWKEIVANFIFDMRWVLSDLRRARDRVKGLSNLINDERSRVIKSMEFRSTQRMQGLSYLAKREAVAVRIISLVTLIFLPCTVVSSFYSTDVVHYESSEGSETTVSKTVFSRIAMNRWLQVALPLTALTLLFGFIAYTLETHLTEQGTRRAQLSARLKRKWPWLASAWSKISLSSHRSNSSRSSNEPKGDNKV